MRLGQRFSAMVSAAIVVLAGVLFLADRGSAAGFVSGARPVAKTAASDGSAAVSFGVPILKAAAFPQQLRLPADGGAYPVYLPQLRVGATRVIQSDGVPLNFQNVGYGDPSEHNSYDVYWPASPSLRRGGAVLMIHGGSWVMGRKELDTPYALAVARAGYAVAVLDYSTLPDLRAWPAAALDTFAASDSFRSRASVYGFDPAHLVAAGWSAGGNLAELLGTVGRGTDRVAAVVSWSGISDLTALPAAKSTKPLSKTVRNLIGCSLSACPQTWMDASPVTHVGTGDAPTLMFAGSREFVPSSQSSALENKLQAAGIAADLQIVDTDHHGGDLRPFTIVPFMDWLHEYADAQSVG